ncbi:MAG: hypothetical protein FJX95_10940 [Bacteroidetes bacterium]|nr:hypothetical protein [Bacteroidota bacterium]
MITYNVISLTVFISFTGKAALFVLIMIGGMDGFVGLPAIITIAVMMAATATKTDPSITALRFFFKQPGSPSS